mgnify:CR=1 FL=1
MIEKVTEYFGNTYRYKEVFKMGNLQRKVKTSISVVMLASLLCAGYVVAEDKDQPKTGKEQGKDKEQGEDKIQKRAGTIFDDQADENEEPTYTPPTDIEEKLKVIPPLPANIKNYLKGKYIDIRDDDLSSTLQQTLYGPLGYINIRGDITPKKGLDSTIIGEGREERARAMAKAFIEEEKSLLGIANIAELNERLHISKGYGGDYIHLYYQRKIGDIELENATIHVTVGPNDTIIGVSAESIAVSPELYKAVSKKTLGRGKVYRIIRQELKIASGGEDVGMGITKAYKVAIPKAPYVIWKVSVSTVDNAWNYKIDAFTGEILEKRSAMRSAK